VSGKGEERRGEWREGREKEGRIQYEGAIASLTGQRQEGLVCGLEPPLQDTHILVEGKGGSLLLHSYHSSLVELALVHLGVRLCVHARVCTCVHVLKKKKKRIKMIRNETHQTHHTKSLQLKCSLIPTLEFIGTGSSSALCRVGMHGPKQ